MNITFIGAGSIGLLLASKFAMEQHVVTVVCHRNEQAYQLNRGIIYKQGENIRVAPVQSTHLLAGDETDLLVVAVKSNQVPSVIKMIQKVYRDNHLPDILFVQNGMGHLSHLSLLQHNILVGVIEHGAKKLDERTVEHTGSGVIRVSAFKGLPNPLANLSTRDFPIYYESDWYQMLAKKLIVNCAINPLSGIYHVTNGELLQNPRFYSVMRELVKESCRVLQLEYEDAWNDTQLICRRTSSNTSSMLADLKAGRVTEIDAITGFILKEAELNGQYVPYSRFVYDSVKGLEMLNR
ncbi:2-dehydropantoate 2-reductase [Guptibacillus hwajinpoensis]|uniref:2-dehydropantoate 2-reductase n=1 Tax=Guptibacillus hwajinpoensis TaxID=208199 RepID=UPI001CFD1D4D|nr:2-dehydropantoate 2-reductase [Pseudalkalibacillus hwajinpoensis]WLR59659.1 2-dehydropantoate 2-reductase [Pseudalkalibacillus hwajinpoensis]